LINFFQRESPEGVPTLSVTYEGQALCPMHDSLLYDVYNARKFSFSLPVDVFFSEEHLNAWLGRKIFAETILLRPEERTKAYFILGNGTISGKHMSSSAGNAIFVQDIARQYNPKAARAYLLGIGDPKKNFDIKPDYHTQLRGAMTAMHRFYSMVDDYARFTIEHNAASARLMQSAAARIHTHVGSGEFHKAIEYVCHIFPGIVKSFGKRTADLDLLIEKVAHVFLGESRDYRIR
jgi:leucyl-tRNA synthetase